MITSKTICRDNLKIKIIFHGLMSGDLSNSKLLTTQSNLMKPFSTNQVVFLLQSGPFLTVPCMCCIFFFSCTHSHDVTLVHGALATLIQVLPIHQDPN